MHKFSTAATKLSGVLHRLRSATRKRVPPALMVLVNPHLWVILVILSEPQALACGPLRATTGWARGLKPTALTVA